MDFLNNLMSSGMTGGGGGMLGNPVTRAAIADKAAMAAKEIWEDRYRLW